MTKFDTKMEEREELIKLLTNKLLDDAMRGNLQECIKTCRSLRIITLEDQLTYADKLGIAKEPLKIELKRLKHEQNNTL